MPDDFEADIRGIAALGEPIRRALYQYVVAQSEPVNREQAAEGAGVAHHTAKFHLDKLVDDGLLEVQFNRPAGRGGPGAGRPTKFYRRAAREVAVSLPARHYELAGRLMARAIVDAEREGIAVSDALRDAAQNVGRGLGAAVRNSVGKRAARPAVVAATTDALRDCGYEPRCDAEGIILANCPFHVLAQEYTELVCGMNLEVMNGMVAGLDDPVFAPRLDPAPGRCCVRLDAR